jgi:hypothetical protein
MIDKERNKIFKSTLKKNLQLGAFMRQERRVSVPFKYKEVEERENDK